MHSTAISRALCGAAAEAVGRHHPSRAVQQDTRHDLDPDDDLAGLRSGPRGPFMPSLLRPPGAPPASTTADVVDLLAQLRSLAELGVDADALRTPDRPRSA